MALSDLEQEIVAAVASREDDLVELTSALVGYDTTARAPADPPRQERELQEHLADRLRRAGAEVELLEADPAQFEGKPLYPPGMGFEDRP